MLHTTYEAPANDITVRYVYVKNMMWIRLVGGNICNDYTFQFHIKWKMDGKSFSYLFVIQSNSSGIFINIWFFLGGGGGGGGV